MAIGAGQTTRFGIGGGIWQPLDITLFANKEAGSTVSYTNLMDAILGVTGGTNIPDGLRTWFSATTSESLNDAERRWLLAFPATSSGTNNDLWLQYLGDLGHTGTINDRKLQYWLSQ